VATETIVAVGGALVDVRARSRVAWAPGRSLPGVARLDAGGAARNVAVNLVRLGHQVTLLSAVGEDPLGAWLLDVTAGAGVAVEHVLRRAGITGLYVSVQSAQASGQPGETGEQWSVADAGLVEGLGAADLARWSTLIAAAGVVIADANLIEETHQALAPLARGARALLATSPDKAARLRPALAGAALVVCNREEALALTGLPGTLSWQALGTALLTEGVERAVITDGLRGIGVITADGTAHAPAPDVPVVDATGAGDAVAAAAVHALLAGLEAEETAHLAATAAAAVLQSPESTPAALADVLRR
jgi:pseudouridine kinase